MHVFNKEFELSKKTDDILEYIVQVREFETELYKTYELLSEIYENEIK